MQAAAKRKREQLVLSAKPDKDVVIHDGEHNEQEQPKDAEQFLSRSVDVLMEQMRQATNNEYKHQYGEDWKSMLTADLDRADDRRKRAKREDAKAAQRRQAFAYAHVGVNGNFSTNTLGYITGWQQNFFTGRYLDDYDSRLP